MARSTTTHATRLLLLAATLTLALGMSLATPAAAFVDDDANDDASEARVEEQADAPAGNGFVDNGDDEREAAPVGGVDAGFGGAAGAASGLGPLHLVAVTLLGLAIVAHTATARRTARVRA